MIDVTEIDLVEFAKEVYELSVPQGMGFLYATPVPLSDDEAKQLVAIWKDDKMYALNMDYVKGRACKMHVGRNGDKLEISDNWYDHTDRIFEQLLNKFNITRNAQAQHGVACNCIDCQSVRSIQTA